ncbi:MAG: hypothetical protein DRG83_00160 [Deltaproteobacteria bacterium]|nr:MAG: hypothetical protein DRG83_00160 [Deltaproteobacteria bacterium]
MGRKLSLFDLLDEEEKDTLTTPEKIAPLASETEIFSLIPRWETKKELSLPKSPSGTISLFDLAEEEPKPEKKEETKKPSAPISLFDLMEKEIEIPKEPFYKRLLRPLEGFYKAIETAAPRSREDIEKIKEGLKIGVKQTIFHTWPEWLTGLRKIAPFAHPVLLGETIAAKIAGKEELLRPTEKVEKELVRKIEKLGPTEEEIEKLKKDPTIRAWARVGGFAADIPRIMGLGYALGPLLGPLAEGASGATIFLARPLLRRVATNPKMLRLAERFLIKLPQRMVTDTAIFSALSAPHPEEMLEAAKTGVTFGLLAGPAGRKLQPITTGLAAYISAKREGASDEDAAWEALMFTGFNKFLPHSEWTEENILKIGGIKSKKQRAYIRDELLKERLGIGKADPEAKKAAANAYMRWLEHYSLPLEKIAGRALSPEETTKVVASLEKFFTEEAKKIKLDPLDEVVGLLEAKADLKVAPALRELERQVTRQKPEDEGLYSTIADLHIKSVLSAAREWKEQIDQLARKTELDKKAAKLLPKATAKLIVEKIHGLLPVTQAKADMSLAERADRLGDLVRITLRKKKSTVASALKALAERAREVHPDDKKKLLDLEKEYENLEKKVFELEQKLIAETPDEQKPAVARQLYTQLSNFIRGEEIQPLSIRKIEEIPEPIPKEEVPPKGVEEIPPEPRVEGTHEGVIPTPQTILVEATKLIDRVSKEAPKKPEIDVDSILFNVKPQKGKHFIFLEDTGEFVEVPKPSSIRVPTEHLNIEPEALDLFTYYSGRFEGWPIILGKTGRVIDVVPDRATAFQRAAEIFANPERVAEILAQAATDIRNGQISPRWRPEEIETERRFSDIIAKHIRNEAEAIKARIEEDPMAAYLGAYGIAGAAAIEPISKAAVEANKFSGIGAIALDIANFKAAINDVFGHPFGDKIIQKIVDTLRSFEKEHHVRFSRIPIRVGGDEFIVFLSARNAKEVENLASSIKKKVTQSIQRMLRNQIQKVVKKTGEKPVIEELGVEVKPSMVKADVTSHFVEKGVLKSPADFKEAVLDTVMAKLDALKQARTDLSQEKRKTKIMNDKHVLADPKPILLALLSKKELETPPVDLEKTPEGKIRISYPDGTVRELTPDAFIDELLGAKPKDKEVEIPKPEEPVSITTPKDRDRVKDLDEVQLTDPSNPPLTVDDLIEPDPAKNRVPEIAIGAGGGGFFRDHMPLLARIIDATKETKRKLKWLYNQLVDPVSRMGVAQQAIIEAWRTAPEITASAIIKLANKAFYTLSTEERILFRLMYTNKDLRDHLMSLEDFPLPREVWGKTKELRKFIELAKNLVLHEARKRGIRIAKWPDSAISRICQRIAEIDRMLREGSVSEDKLIELELERDTLYETMKKLKSEVYFPRSLIPTEEGILAAGQISAMMSKAVNDAIYNVLSNAEKRLGRQKLREVLENITSVVSAKEFLQNLDKLGVPKADVGVQDKIILTTLMALDDMPLPPIDISPALRKLGIQMGRRGYAVVPVESVREKLRLDKIIPQHKRKFNTEAEAMLWALENGMGYVLDPVYDLANYLHYMEERFQFHDAIEAMKKASIEDLRQSEILAKQMDLKTPSAILGSNTVILPLSEAARLKAQYDIDLRELGWREWGGQPPIPNLKGHLVHPLIEAWLKDEMYVPWFSRYDTPAPQWLKKTVRSIDKLVRVTKMMRFYIPMIMIVNDLGQMWMLGAAGPASLVKGAAIDVPLLAFRAARKAITGRGSIVTGQKYYGFLGYLAKAMYDVAAETDLYLAAKKAGLFISPVRDREDVGKLAVHLLERSKRHPLIKPLVALRQTYRTTAPHLGLPIELPFKVLHMIYKDGLQWLTWKGDQIARMTALNWYLDRRAKMGTDGKLWVEHPLEFKKAVNMVRKFMVNYRGIPQRTRRTLNFAFLTPTYRIEVLKLYKDIAKGLVTDPKEWIGPAARIFTAKSIAFTVRWWLRIAFLRMLAPIVGAALSGFDEDDLERIKEKYRDWKLSVDVRKNWTLQDWYHLVRELPGGLAEVVVLPSPLFEIDKWLGRDPRYSLRMYSSGPIHLAWSLLLNRDWKGDEIVPPAVGPIEAASRVTAYIIRQGFIPWLEMILLSDRDNWKWWNWLLASMAIVHYKGKSQKWRLIAAYRRAEWELMRYRAKAMQSGDPKDLQRYLKMKQRLIKLKQNTVKALLRQESPRLIDQLINSYGKIFGVGKETYETWLYWDINNFLRGEY